MCSAAKQVQLWRFLRRSDKGRRKTSFYAPLMKAFDYFITLKRVIQASFACLLLLVDEKERRKCLSEPKTFFFLISQTDFQIDRCSWERYQIWIHDRPWMMSFTGSQQSAWPPVNNLWKKCTRHLFLKGFFFLPLHSSLPVSLRLLASNKIISC